MDVFSLKIEDLNYKLLLPPQQLWTSRRGLVSASRGGGFPESGRDFVDPVAKSSTLELLFPSSIL